MFSASKLSDDQKDALKAWAAEGDSIADLQKRLKEEFDIGITYMDARFLVLDLNIEIKQEQPEPEKTEDPEPGPAGEPVDAEAEVVGGEPTPEAPAGTNVSVSLDSITRPGALVSGKVTFTDGETAEWMLDQYGRPGLDPATEGYRPTEADVQAFQVKLSSLLREQGY